MVELETALPKGAKKIVMPQGAKVIEETQESTTEKKSLFGFKRDIASQFLSGIQDITSLIASPLEKTIGAPTIGPEGLSYKSPEEIEQLKEEGQYRGIPGAAREDPDSIFGKGSRVAGQTATLGPVLGRAAGFVKAPIPAGTITGKIAQFPKKLTAELGKRFAEAPIKTTIAETGLGFTAGAGGYTAGKIFPDSDAAVFIGEVIGGTAPVLMPTRLAIRAGGGLRNIYQTIRHPFTGIGGRSRAAARAQRAGGPEERLAALKELEKPTTVDTVTRKPVLTPAQRTGDPGLLSLERAVMDSSEELRRAGDRSIAHANETIQKSLEGLGGETSAAEVPIKEAQDYLSNLLETRVRISAQRADERISELGPKASREQLNLVAREEAEKALAAARTQENELWEAFSPDLSTPFSKSKARFNAFRRELGQAQQGDIPAVATRFLSENSDEFFGKHLPVGFRKGETRIKELRALQSKLRQEARNARVGDKRNLNKARIADEIADAITDDLSNVRSGPETSKAIAIAVDFSRGLNERFSSGTMSKILGRRIAGERVPAGLTLEESIGVSGPKAREAMDDLIKAFDSPEAPSSALLMDAAEDFTRGRFLQSAIVQGQINVRAARRFVSQNEELLNRLPKVKNQINEAIESGDAYALAQRQKARVNLDDPRVSKATMLIDKGPAETFRQISKLKPSEAARETQKLVNRVSHDETGEALSGLKSGFLEYLYSTSRESARDIMGRKFISGFALRDTLEKTRSSAGRLFSADELKRLDTIVDDLVRLEKRRGAQVPPEGVIGDKPSKLIETVAGIAGAAVGRNEARRLGVGGTVQIPGIMAERFRTLVAAGIKDPAGRLIRDAITDEALFKELLQSNLEEGGKKLSSVAARRLSVWTASVLAEYGGAFEEEPSE